MPYDSISDAKDAGFPTKIRGVELTLGQINHLSKIYDALSDEEDVDDPMAVAITQFLQQYKTEGDGDDKKFVRKAADSETEITGMARENAGHSHTVMVVVRRDDYYESVEITGVTSMDEGHFHRVLWEDSTTYAALDGGDHNHRIEWNDDFPRAIMDAAINKSKRVMKTDDEKRLATGGVLIPFERDTDQEMITDREIEETFYDQSLRRAKQGGSGTGIMHKGAAVGGVWVVEDYLAPDTLVIGGTVYPAGSWIRTVKVEDDDIWAMIKSGELTGFSIQGYCEDLIPVTEGTEA